MPAGVTPMKGFGSKTKAPKVTGARTGGLTGKAYKKGLGNKLFAGPLGPRPTKTR